MDYFEESSPLLASVETEVGKWKKRREFKKHFFVGVAAITLTLTVLTLTAVFSDNATSSGQEQDQSFVLKASGQDGRREEAKSQRSPIVKVEEGRVQGIVERSRKGRDYFAFYSLPYGEAPVGELRFKPPKPAPKWRRQTVRDASESVTQCIQVNKQFQVVGSEDCLHVHVFTPKFQLPEHGRRRKNPQLPVMVYLYGGGFFTGTVRRFKASYFMDEDVILVIVDHRLGALGHLNTKDRVAVGNLSFRDQNLALKWVKKNIAQFGGSTENILLFGSSSGSVSVHAQMFSTMNEGLFNAAMCESGVSIGPVSDAALAVDTFQLAQNLALELGCQNVNDSQTIVDCLRKIDATKIVELNMKRPDLKWGPTKEAIDSETDPNDIFWQDTPINLLKQGKFIKVPFHLGVNSAEEYGAAYDLLRTPETIKALNENFTEVVMKGQLKFKEERIDTEFENRIKQFYFGGDYIDRKKRDNLTDLLSDRAWIHPTRIVAHYHGKYSPVYLHYFSKEPTVSLYDAQKGDFEPPHRAGHGDQVQFLFPYDPFPDINLDDESAGFSMDFVKIWVSIARNNGVPTVDEGLKWEPIKEEDNGTIWFQINDKNLRGNVQPFTQRLQFWDSVPLELLYD